MPDDDENKIGYKAPPKKHRFAKGRSGNPKGRPRKPRPAPRDDSLKAILERAANETIVVNGRAMTMRELEIRSLQAKALKRHMPATKQLWALRELVGAGAIAVRQAGMLIVPEYESDEDWIKSAAEQQAQFRHSDYLTLDHE